MSEKKTLKNCNLEELRIIVGDKSAGANKIREFYSSNDGVLDEEKMLNDISAGYLTINTARNNEVVFWYFCEEKEFAIYASSGKYLTQAEIERQLC